MKPVALTLRLPRDLHRALVAKAKREHRSLNQLIVLTLLQLPERSP